MKKRMLIIPSVPSQISKVEDYLQSLISEFNIDNARYPDILISLTEAVNNAIIHGNQKDSDKKVKICMERENNQVTVVVSDEGTGFEMSDVPDPTNPENIECCGGRGVHIMSSLCDKINFQNNGSTVLMSFHV